MNLFAFDKSGFKFEYILLPLQDHPRRCFFIIYNWYEKTILLKGWKKNSILKR